MKYQDDPIVSQFEVIRLVPDAPLETVPLDVKACQRWRDRVMSGGEYLDHVDSHWIWKKALNSAGYPVTNLDGKIRYAHRVMFTAVRGPIPIGLTLDHVCRVPLCINPDDLEPVSNRENALRARRPYCPQGHLLVPSNLVISAAKRGGRMCKLCQQERSRRQFAVLQEARKLLGLSWSEYTQAYGRAESTALRIIEEHRP